MKPVSKELTVSEKLELCLEFISDLHHQLIPGDLDPATGRTVVSEDCDFQGAFVTAVEMAREIDGRCSVFDVVEYELPSIWASALINGDFSGLNDEEKTAVEEWLKSEEHPNVVSCGSESYLSRGNDATNRLCDTLKFQALVPKEKAPDPYAKLVEAAREFCRKVESGEARSVRSYAAFKNALLELSEDQ